jgi:hypothetical protein
MKDKKPTPAERSAYMSMETVINSIEPAITDLKRRFGSPEAQEAAVADALGAMATLRKLLDAAEENMPEATRDYIIANSRRYEVVIRERRAVKDPNWMYVKTEDLEQLCTEAISGKCFMCIASGDETKRCQMRKLLQQLIDEPESTYSCGYANYAHESP